MMNPEKSCEWYVTEDENMDYVHCENDDGFCLVKDLFTRCYGKCEEFHPCKEFKSADIPL